MAAYCFFMAELNDFYNKGFGWICLRCEKDLVREIAADLPSRLIREGEAEGKNPSLSTEALAKWADPAHSTLTCPRCGISELVEKR